VTKQRRAAGGLSEAPEEIAMVAARVLPGEPIERATTRRDRELRIGAEAVRAVGASPK
jgi:hypothetical protein